MEQEDENFVSMSLLQGVEWYVTLFEAHSLENKAAMLN